MCGICGVYNHSNAEPVNERLLDAMLATISHRGPDDQGVFIDQDMGFGMRRLSIIDLAGGQQPIFNEHGNVAVVLNGEIYNYRELAEQLRQRGHTLKSSSDTEVIVHLYEEYGAKCLDYLRGMFAFAVWDARERRLFIARDRLGIKPLYYTQVGQRLVFASEIKAILQHSKVPRELDEQALSHYLSFKYVPAPHTMFEGIVSLPPGHTLTCDARGVQVEAYWDLSFDVPKNPIKSEQAYAEELEHLLHEALQLHLRSDVPFGAFLSGGVDSSTIVALMSQYLDEPVRTFSVGFERTGHETDELPYARLIAETFQTDHHEVIITPQDFMSQAETMIWHMDQPLADQATVATYMVSKLASEHVKMVLTGEGGDELFAGYARYSGERLSPFFRRSPAAAKNLALAISARVPGLRRPKLALYALCNSDEASRMANWFPLFNQDMKASLLSREFARSLGQDSSNEIFAEQLAKTDATAPINRMLYVDTKLWLADFLLLRGDKMSMANSLEARVPLLDHKLVEFAASLPPHLKLKRLTHKYLLKQVSRKLLPKQVIDRKKQGFPIPIANWFRNEAKSMLHDLLAPDSLRQRGLFNAPYVEKLIGEHERGFADHGNLLWGLMNVELWQRTFLDTPPTSPTPHAQPNTIARRASPTNERSVTS